jgi:hypothetical protein
MEQIANALAAIVGIEEVGPQEFSVVFRETALLQRRRSVLHAEGYELFDGNSWIESAFLGSVIAKEGYPECAGFLIVVFVAIPTVFFRSVDLPSRRDPQRERWTALDRF